MSQNQSQPSGPVTAVQLAAKLEEHQFSADEFAALAGLNHTTVRKFVRGHQQDYRLSTHRLIREGIEKLEIQRKARIEQFRNQMDKTKDVQWA